MGRVEESCLLAAQENEPLVPMREEGGMHLGLSRSWKIGSAFGFFAIVFVSTFLLVNLVIHRFAEGRTLRDDHYRPVRTSRGTSHGSVDCHRTEVDHLSDCPELMELLPMLLENKRTLLGLSLQALLSGVCEKCEASLYVINSGEDVLPLIICSHIPLYRSSCLSTWLCI